MRERASSPHESSQIWRRPRSDPDSNHELASAADIEPRDCPNHERRAPLEASRASSVASPSASPGSRAAVLRSWLQRRRRSHVRWRAPATRLRLLQQPNAASARGRCSGKERTVVTFTDQALGVSDVRAGRTSRDPIPQRASARGHGKCTSAVDRDRARGARPHPNLLCDERRITRPGCGPDELCAHLDEI